MTETLLDILKMLYMDKESDYVFGYDKGRKPFNSSWVSKSFREGGVKNFRFHNLRHDFCSTLVQKGADLYSVAGLAGHKDIKTTQRYTHRHPKKLRSAIQIVNSGVNLATMEKIKDRQNVVSH